MKHISKAKVYEYEFLSQINYYDALCYSKPDIIHYGFGTFINPSSRSDIYEYLLQIKRTIKVIIREFNRLFTPENNLLSTDKYDINWYKTPYTKDNIYEFLFRTAITGHTYHFDYSNLDALFSKALYLVVKNIRLWVMTAEYFYHNEREAKNIINMDIEQFCNKHITDNIMKLKRVNPTLYKSIRIPFTFINTRSTDGIKIKPLDTKFIEQCIKDKKIEVLNSPKSYIEITHKVY